MSYCRLLVALTSVAMFGCGGDDKEDDRGNDVPVVETGPCAKPAGQYKQTFALQSGDCGGVSDFVVDLTNGGAAVGTVASICGGMGSASADGCKYQIDTTCAATPTNLEQLQIELYDGTPPTLRIIGTTNWERSADRGSGLWAFTRTSPLAGCHSTYQTQLTRL